MEEKAFEYIEIIAAKLGVASEHVWETLVKQQVVEAWCGIIYASVALIFMITVDIITIRGMTKAWKDCADEFMAYIFITAVISMVCCMVIGFQIPVIATGFINPEYGAIKEILEIM